MNEHDGIRSDELVVLLMEACGVHSGAVDPVAPALLHTAARSTNPALRLAATLYTATRHNRDRRHDLASAELDSAASLVEQVTDPVLLWWFHHTHSLTLHHARKPLDAARVARRAADIALTIPGYEHQWEWSQSNMLFSLRLAGHAEAAAHGFIDFARQKPSNSNQPYFYQMVSDTLLWLGDAELALAIRQAGYENTPQAPAVVARDQREIARYHYTLGDYAQAESWLAKAEQHTSHASERHLTQLFKSELRAATGDLDQAEAILARELDGGQRTLSADGSALHLAMAYLEHQQPVQAERILDGLTSLTPYHHAVALTVRAGIAQHHNDHERTARLLEQATPVIQKRWPRPETVIELRSAIEPLINNIRIRYTLSGNLARRAQNSDRWAISCARDIRRILAPALLSYETDLDPVVHTELIRSTIDELRIVQLLHADAQRSITGNTHSETTSALQHLYANNQNTLQLPAHCDYPLPIATTFALIALEHLQPHDTVAITADHDTVVTVITTSNPVQIRNISATLKQLRHGDDAERLPSFRRGSVISALETALNTSWTISASNDSANQATIRATRRSRTVAKPDPSAISTDADLDDVGEINRVGASRQAFVAEGPEDSRHLRVRLADAFDRRAFDREIDDELIATIEATGDSALLQAAYAVAAVVSCRGGDLAAAEHYLGRFDHINPHAAHRFRQGQAWMGLSVIFNVRLLLSDSQATFQRSSRLVSHEAIEKGKEGTPQLWAVHNKAMNEIERWALTDALQYGYIFGFTSDEHPDGDLQVRAQVAAALGDHDYASRLANLGIRISQGIDQIEFLRVGVRMALSVRSLDLARDRLDHLRAITGLDPDTIVFEAWYLLESGSPGEARRYLAEKYWSRERHYEAVTKGLANLVDARAAHELGDVNKALDLLSEIPLDRVASLDLLHRLRTEIRFAELAGDFERVARLRRYELERAQQLPRFESEPELRSQVHDFLDRLVAERVSSSDAATVAARRVLAHDLGNILTVIVLDVQLAAQSGNAPGDYSKNALASIVALADHLENATTTTIRTSAERTTLDEIVHEVIGSISAQNRDPDRKVMIEAMSRLNDIEVLRDQAWRLQTVLSNLISNAAKFCTERVLVTTELAATPAVAEASVVAITVHDDGPGLSPDQRSRFGEYVRGPESSGVGLGLWIVKHYTNGIGGDVEVGRSELGGAAFTLTFPIGTLGPSPTNPDAPRSEEPVPEQQSPSQQSPSQQSRESAGRRILIVDDDHHLLQILGAVLRSLGHSVMVARTADDVSSLLCRNDIPDAIISDIDLNDTLTGFDVYEIARRRGFHGTFALMTGHDTATVTETIAERFGNNLPVLAKPFDRNQIEGLLKAGTARDGVSGLGRETDCLGLSGEASIGADATDSETESWFITGKRERHR